MKHRPDMPDVDELMANITNRQSLDELNTRVREKQSGEDFGLYLYNTLDRRSFESFIFSVLSSFREIGAKYATITTPEQSNEALDALSAFYESLKNARENRVKSNDKPISGQDWRLIYQRYEELLIRFSSAFNE